MAMNVIKNVSIGLIFLMSSTSQARLMETPSIPVQPDQYVATYAVLLDEDQQPLCQTALSENNSDLAPSFLKTADAHFESSIESIDLPFCEEDEMEVISAMASQAQMETQTAGFPFILGMSAVVCAISAGTGAFIGAGNRITQHNSEDIANTVNTGMAVGGGIGIGFGSANGILKSPVRVVATGLGTVSGMACGIAGGALGYFGMGYFLEK